MKARAHACIETRFALCAAFASCAFYVSAPCARAQVPELGADDLPPSRALTPEQAFKLYAKRPQGYFRFVGTLAFGSGFRFNNPYRLASQLGDTAESLSLTSGYFDMGAALCFGAPNGLQHGASLHLSFALSGVSQQILTPAYTALYRGPHRILAYGRAGPAIILSPDAGLGAEIAGAAGYFLTAKIAVYTEIVGNLFYGAGTTEVKYAVYPVLSGQIGLMIDHEILP